MFLNFLKVTLRTLYREKVYAIINIAGLSIAIACCTILGLWLKGELTYDQHNKKYKQIFRVECEYVEEDGKTNATAMTTRLLGPILTEEYDEVKGFVRFAVIEQKLLLRHEDKAFYWDHTAIASNSVFEIFDHDFIYGDPETAKTKPFYAVSETFAKKYWGNENPVGKIITREGYPAIITHVFADLPENSHLRYDVLCSEEIPFFTEKQDAAERDISLWWTGYYTYLLMPKDYNVHDFKDIADSFYKRHMVASGKAVHGGTLGWDVWLQPLADIHYNSNSGLKHDLPTGNKNYLYGFAAVAIFILLVACINYMNLATARAAKRAKEVGLRKILGSDRLRLMLQFIGESLFFVFIAMFIGLVIVEVVLKLTPLSQLLGKNLSLDFSQQPLLIAWVIIFSFLFGLMSGIYPAIYLSSLVPVSTLMSDSRSGKGSVRMRELLVLVQFAISICVIVCTLIMSLQMQYLYSKSLGFKKENRVIVPLRTGNVIDRYPVMKKEMLKNSSILVVSTCTKVIGDVLDGVMIPIENNNGTSPLTDVNYMDVGNDFINVMGIEMAEGRDYSKRLITDVGNAIIVNEALVKEMGWDQPLSRRVAGNRVIGVVKDFNFGSLHRLVSPLIINKLPNKIGNYTQDRDKMIQYLVVNITGEEMPQTLSFIEDTMAEFDPIHPFEFKFLDDYLNELYFSEQRLMKLVGIFAAVCIFISCLGLFGLAAFTTEQRTKEIGVRKVMGASTMQLIAMLVRNMFYLVMVGAVVASLAAYYAMDEWLSDFAYRININSELWVFLVSALIVVFVALVTIAAQSFKTAQSDPVKALRYE